MTDELRSKLERSQLATRKGIVNRIPDEGLDTWERGFNAIVQPIIDAGFSWIDLTSGYRCPELNKALGGSKTSQHTGIWNGLNCCAFDLDYPKPDELMQWCYSHLSALPIDQLILEHESWVHFSYVEGVEPRRQALHIFKRDGKTITEKWEPAGRLQRLGNNH